MTGNNAQQKLVRNSVLSMLGGGGLYAILRGLREANLKPKGDEESDELVVTIPRSQLPKTAADSLNGKLIKLSFGDSDNVQKGLMNALQVAAPAASGVLGFAGAKELYEALRKRQLKDEEQELEQKYLSQLEQISAKTAHLKNVNQFCDVVADGLLKQSNLSMLTQAGNLGKETPKTIGQKAVNAGKEVFDSGSDVAMPAVAGLFFLSALLGGGGTQYLQNMKKEREREDSRHKKVPTNVRLKVV